MSVLLQSFYNPVKHRKEVLRYFPIAVVAFDDVDDDTDDDPELLEGRGGRR
jgi:hypothetical protein